LGGVTETVSLDMKLTPMGATLAVALEAGDGIKTTAVEIALSGYPCGGYLLLVFPA